MRVSTVLVLLVLSCPWAVSADDRTADELPRTPFVIVELFTSQGCSSCPPADRLLWRISREAVEQSKPIYTLSHHVDYWNSLGWIDPYSGTDATKRQKRYSRVIGKRGPYTPQAVVNGVGDVVGSNERVLRRLIRRALEKPAAVGLSLSAAPSASASAVTVSYKVGRIQSGSALQLALVDSPPQNYVQSGENAGRTLSHANVVRAFKTVAAKPGQEGETELQLPPGWKGGSLVGFIQNVNSMKIFGAAKVDLLSRAGGVQQ